MNKVLYCYKVDELTGLITQYEIKDYEFHKSAYGNKNHDTWSFRGIISKDCNYRYCIERFKLNRYVNQKLFTFNPSMDYGRKIIIDTIMDKAKQAHREEVRYKEILEKIGAEI